jgi:hypothetical protein
MDQIKGVSGNDLGRPRTAFAELCRPQFTTHGLVAVLGRNAARTGDYSKKSKIPITVAEQINAIRLTLFRSRTYFSWAEYCFCGGFSLTSTVRSGSLMSSVCP